MQIKLCRERHPPFISRSEHGIVSLSTSKCRSRSGLWGSVELEYSRAQKLLWRKTWAALTKGSLWTVMRGEAGCPEREVLRRQGSNAPKQIYFERWTQNSYFFYNGQNKDLFPLNKQSRNITVWILFTKHNASKMPLARKMRQKQTA